MQDPTQAVRGLESQLRSIPTLSKEDGYTVLLDEAEASDDPGLRALARGARKALDRLVDAIEYRERLAAQKRLAAEEAELIRTRIRTTTRPSRVGRGGVGAAQRAAEHGGSRRSRREERDKIIEYLKQHPGHQVPQIVDGTGIEYRLVQLIVSHQLRAGRLTAVQQPSVSQFGKSTANGYYVKENA